MEEERIIGVVSAKGGVGKTTIVANLAVAMAAVFSKRILAIDVNLDAPNLGLYLDLVNPPVTLLDVLQDKIPVYQSIYAHKTGVDLIPGNLMAREKVSLGNLKEKIKVVAGRYDAIFLDSGPGIGENVREVIEASDELIAVTNPEFLTVTTTYKTVKVAREMEVPIRGVVLNRVEGRRHEMGKEEVENSLHLPVISVVPEDPKIREAANLGMSIVTYSPGSPSSKEFKRLAAGLSGEEYVAGFFARGRKLIQDTLFKKPERRKIREWPYEIVAGEERPRAEEEEFEFAKKIISEYKAERAASKMRVIKAALERLKKNYEEGLLREEAYADLKDKYEKVLKGIEAEIEE
jgi:septum site-determining protein MinD